MTATMKAAQAGGEHWGLAAKTCIGILEPFPAGANLGLLYVTPGFADDLSSIVTFLRETTPITHWFGAVGHGIFGPISEVREGRAMAIMVGQVEAGALCPFERFDPTDSAGFVALHGAWLARQSAITGLVHGDPREPEMPGMVAGLAAAGNAFLIGGLTVAGENPAQVCGKVIGSGLSGVLMGDRVRLATGLSQGCTPIGPLHRVTEAVDSVVMALDGAPALEALKAAAGDIIARDLKRANGYIHIARPVEGSDGHEYVVRGLLAIDTRRGWLAVGERLCVGDRLMFVRRDASAAQRDLKRMLTDLAKRIDGQPIRGGVYVSCVARGAQMFGGDSRETEMIFDALGPFPLVGFSASGEICNDRLYGFTGILALFL